MAGDERGRSVKLPKPRGDLDLEAVRTGLGLRGTAAAMLEQYDRQHADVLNELKEGMKRPSAVLPPRLDINDPEKVFRATSGGILALRYLSTGLALRAGLVIVSPPHSPLIPPLTAIDAARLKTYNAQYRDGFSVARIEQALRRIPLTPIPTRLDKCM